MGTNRNRARAALTLVMVAALAACNSTADGPTGRVEPAASKPAAKPAESKGTVGRVEPAAEMTVDRASHEATLLADGTVLLTGGFRGDEIGLDSAELFDPAAGAFRPVGQMSSVRKGGHVSVLLPDGRVLVAGGWAGSSSVTAAAELYDPATGQFTPTGSLSTARANMVAALLPDGSVLLAGGVDGQVALDSAERYDPATGTFGPAGRLTVPRSDPAIAALPDGRVLLVGGGAAGGPDGEVLASAEVYDSKTGEFRTTGSMGSERYKAAAAALPDGRVLVLGGSDDRDWTGQHRSTEIYDPATGEFRTAGTMHAGRFKIGSAVAVLPTGTVVVAGSDRSVESYDPAKDAFRLASGEVSEEYHTGTATALADGRVLIAGGYDSGIRPTASSWLFRP